MAQVVEQFPILEKEIVCKDDRVIVLQYDHFERVILSNIQTKQVDYFVSILRHSSRKLFDLTNAQLSTFLCCVIDLLVGGQNGALSRELLRFVTDNKESPALLN